MFVLVARDAYSTCAVCRESFLEAGQFVSNQARGQGIAERFSADRDEIRAGLTEIFGVAA